jgi:hypothetical protein
MGGSRFEIVAINLDESEEDARRFLEQHPVSYTILLDPAGITPAAWQLKLCPSFCSMPWPGGQEYAGFASGTPGRSAVDAGACGGLLLMPV